MHFKIHSFSTSTSLLPNTHIQKTNNIQTNKLLRGSAGMLSLRKYKHLLWNWMLRVILVHVKLHFLDIVLMSATLSYMMSNDNVNYSPTSGAGKTGYLHAKQ